MLFPWNLFLRRRGLEKNEMVMYDGIFVLQKNYRKNLEKKQFSIFFHFLFKVDFSYFENSKVTEFVSWLCLFLLIPFFRNF